ncbi:TAP-like protein-domain-containing protein [Aspergillus aurantiobrunneus]
MYFLHALIPAVLFSTVSARVDWSPCNETESSPIFAPFQCASLDVPFDYTDSNCTETLTLQLLKIPAPLGSRGSILTNPGGPGQSGRSSIAQLASTLIPLTGGEHDIIAFDTRGTENTIPFECTQHPIDQYEMYRALVHSNSSEGAIGMLWARGTIDSEQCAANASRIGSVLTTPFVARDMMQVVDALEEDGLLRYWGISYGTILGATVAAMFPDRVDKVILDAVQNPHEYYHSPANIESWTDSDAAFFDLFDHCVKAGPELCPLAAHNKTAAALQQMTWRLLDRVKLQPIPMGPMLIDYAGLKGYFQQATYGMQNWPGLIMLLDNLLFNIEYDDLQSTLQTVAQTLSTNPAVRELARRAAMAFTGISCSDNQVRTASLHDFLPTISTLYNKSRLFGDGGVATFMGCQQWKIPPKEVYSGPFEAQTNTPLLIIGNTLDAHTPLKSAHNVSTGYEGSVVLEVNGNGHGSTTVPSMCLFEKTTAFWRNGTLPEEGTVCERDVEPFTGAWWYEVLQEGGVDEALLVYDAGAGA